MNVVEQLSVAVGSVIVTTAVHKPASAVCVISAAHVITGGSLSVTITSWVQTVVFAGTTLSEKVHVIVVVPTGQGASKAALSLLVPTAVIAPSQLSWATGAVTLALFSHELGSLLYSISFKEEQSNTGAISSVTVTTSVTVPLLQSTIVPSVSVTVNETVKSPNVV